VSGTERAARLRELLPNGLPLEVDGGVDALSGRQCAQRGATALVAGHFVYSHPQGKRAAIARGKRSEPPSIANPSWPR